MLTVTPPHRMVQEGNFLCRPPSPLPPCRPCIWPSAAANAVFHLLALLQRVGKCPVTGKRAPHIVQVSTCLTMPDAVLAFGSGPAASP